MTAPVPAAPVPVAPAAAVVHAERILTIAAVVARLAAVVALLAAVVPPPRTATAPIVAIVAVGTVESLTYVVVCARRGVVTAGWAALATLTTVVLIWPGGALVHAADPAAGNPAYNYMMISVLAVGLARWPPWCALLGAVLLSSAVLVANTISAPTGYPTWNAPSDAVAPLGVTAVVTVIAVLQRTAAAQLDRYRREAVTRAATLGEERERVRQADALRGTLLSTLEDLAAGEAVADPVVRDQLRAEVSWLREVVSSGLVSTPTALNAALRQLVAEKSGQRIRLELALPAEEPRLSPAAVEALVEAAREALTNVAKHAGTMSARIAVFDREDGVAVEVSDEGIGFDPATARVGVGLGSSIRQRLAEVGGSAEVITAPGAGTRVRLTATHDPVRQEDPR